MIFGWTGGFVVPESFFFLPRTSSRTGVLGLRPGLLSVAPLGLEFCGSARTPKTGTHRFSELPALKSSLPLQFDDATNRTIELIDVLWLDRNAIVAAFEIESTTSIYSGLLRMADLVAMQPNLNIPLFLVPPEERREKVFAEVNRPTVPDQFPLHGIAARCTGRFARPAGSIAHVRSCCIPARSRHWNWMSSDLQVWLPFV